MFTVDSNAMHPGEIMDDFGLLAGRSGKEFVGLGPPQTMAATSRLDTESPVVPDKF
jgi:hypothetical protein